MANDYLQTNLGIGRSDAAKIKDLTTTNAELEQISGQIFTDMTEGAGISDGASTICEHRVSKIGGIFKTEILLDITSLKSSTTDLDIIGTGTSAANLGQITAAKNGTIVYGTMLCLETPATGVVDIDVYSATAGTGAFDSGIALLTETALLTKGGNWAAAAATPIIMTVVPPADGYLYLTCGAAGTVGTYTAGIFLIELWGV